MKNANSYWIVVAVLNLQIRGQVPQNSPEWADRGEGLSRDNDPPLSLLNSEPYLEYWQVLDEGFSQPLTPFSEPSFREIKHLAL